MPQLTEPYNLPPAPFVSLFSENAVMLKYLSQTQTDSVFANSTVRQTLHMSIGAKQIRIRISNSFGTTNLPITAATVALTFNDTAGSSAIVPGTTKKITFSGSDSIIIPNGALAVSDPINFPIKPESMITVSLYLATGQPSNYVTSHPGSRTTSWFAFGNHVEADDIVDPSKASAAHWSALPSLYFYLERLIFL